MKRILIIGATSAIATACARRWAMHGAAFFLAGRSPEKLAALANDLTVRGARAVTSAQFLAQDTAAHPALLDAALDALGGIDVVLVAHGSLPDQTACQADPGCALEAFEINASSVIAVLTLLANQLERQGHGALAVITSVAGDRGRPSNYVYGSAKAAVSVFCEGLRARLHKAGVSLSDIRPGFVDTPMTQGMTLPAALVVSPDVIAKRIVTGIERNADIVYAPAFWWAIMLVIRYIPPAIYKRLTL
ncbi:SDR family oxidoreductase [Thauera mechernichensis]